MIHDITITTPQKTITADTKALEWALDPYAVVFLETVAELIQVRIWQEKQHTPPSGIRSLG